MENASRNLVPVLQHSSKKTALLLARESVCCALRSVRLVLDLSLVGAGDSMLKFVIVGAASLALMGTSIAADLPHPQPVMQTGPVGKYPVGKYPVGKTPVGKYPIGKTPAPLVTKG